MKAEQLTLPGIPEASKTWLQEARAVARIIAMQRGEITIEDVRNAVPPPSTVGRGTLGQVWYPKQNWRFVRYDERQQSDRRGSIGGRRAVAVWSWQEHEA